MMRKISKPAAIFLVFHMLLLSGPFQSAWAAMISTESIMHVVQSPSSGNHLNTLLARENIKAVLISYGIEPWEAQARIDHLSDDELGKLIHEIDQLPAGGGGHLMVFTLITILLFCAVVDFFYNDPPPDKN